MEMKLVVKDFTTEIEIIETGIKGEIILMAAEVIRHPPLLNPK
jgi:hypothetical protein